ncbi:MAG: DUF6580 family putative transport protein [bacterium]
MNIILAVILIIFGIVMRLLPHPANFAPILAIGLFAGTYLDRKYAFWLPLIIMLISDFFLGFYNVWVMLAVYSSFILAVLIGVWIRKHKSLGNVFAGSIAGSLLFFFVTNFAVWLGTNLYPQTIDGLINCFILAIPFFRSSLASDLVYTSVLFGAYELVKYASRNKKLAFKQLFNTKVIK